MKNQSFLKKLGDFVLGKGFYIVLFLCVAAIGISGYYLLQTVVGSTRPTEPVGGDASVTIPDQSAVRPSVPVPVPDQDTAVSKPSGTKPDTSVQEDDPQPVKDTSPQPETREEPVSKVFTWPVQGTVLRDYSVEALSLDPTMGDWRTHSGLDIAALEGVNVLSISAGTVEQVYDDALMGTTVVVDHGGGLRSWYCNLAPETSVQAGDKVEIGSVLGTVGRSAMAEVGEEPHLHLEVVLDGQSVDPRSYLK